MKLKWDKNYFAIGLTAFVVIACAILFFLIINRFDVIWGGVMTVINILMPIIVGLIIAYLLNPLMNFFERVCYKKISANREYSRLRRALSLVSTILLFLVIIGGFFWLLIPQLVASIVSLANQIPSYLDSARVFLENLVRDYPILSELGGAELAEFLETIKDNYNPTELVTNLMKLLPSLDINEVLNGTTQTVMNVVSSFMNLFVGFVVAIYLLYSKERFAGQAKKVMFALLPRNFTLKTINVLSQADKMFSGYIFGKMVEAFVIALLCFVGCTLLGIPYAVLVSVIMFFFNLIPYFGPLIGAIPCTLLILLIDPWKALWFVILICVLQQFDGNVIGPMILGSHTGLSSLWIIFSIFFFGGFFGFVGMIIGVPTFAVIYSLIRALVEKRLKEKGLPLSTRDYMKMRNQPPDDPLIIVESGPREPKRTSLMRRIFTKNTVTPKNAEDEKPKDTKETESKTDQVE